MGNSPLGENPKDSHLCRENPRGQMELANTMPKEIGENKTISNKIPLKSGEKHNTVSVLRPKDERNALHWCKFTLSQ